LLLRLRHLGRVLLERCRSIDDPDPTPLRILRAAAFASVRLHVDAFERRYGQGRGSFSFLVFLLCVFCLLLLFLLCPFFFLLRFHLRGALLDGFLDAHLLWTPQRPRSILPPGFLCRWSYRCLLYVGLPPA